VITCCETFGGTAPRCLCLLPGEHAGPHVCVDCGAAWRVATPPVVMWPGPGGAVARRERLRTLYAARVLPVRAAADTSGVGGVP
jgi:hypothetical protein